MKTIEFNIITLFPEMFFSPFNSSMLKRGQNEGIIKINIHNLRDFTQDKHRITDDTPYGGGPGMVLKVEPIAIALEKIASTGIVLLLTPQGKTFTQKTADSLAKNNKITMICGKYEGVDERVRELVDEEISVGDYILTGGEIPAMIIVDAVSRLLPGVLGDNNSLNEESFSRPFLEYPHYTRPENFRGSKVPEVLLSGHHELIRRWRKRESIKRTWERRKDLLDHVEITEEEEKILKDIRGD